MDKMIKKYLNEGKKISLKIEKPNFTVISIGDTDFYFSYETIVAVRTNDKLYCTASEYSQTTAKHLNAIEPNKNKRTPADEFNKMLNSIDVSIKT